MIKKTMIPLVLFVVLIAGVVNVSAKDNRFGGPMDGPMFGRMGEMPHGMAEPAKRFELLTIALDLNESQQAQIKKIVKKERQQMKQYRTQMADDKTRLWALMSEQPFNETEFRSLATKLADQKIDMMVNRVKTKQKVFAILSAEQQEKAQKIWDLISSGKRGKGKRAMAGRG